MRSRARIRLVIIIATSLILCAAGYLLFTKQSSAKPGKPLDPATETILIRLLSVVGIVLYCVLSRFQLRHRFHRWRGGYWDRDAADEERQTENSTPTSLRNPIGAWPQGLRFDERRIFV